MPKRKLIAPRTSHEKETITVEATVEGLETVCRASNEIDPGRGVLEECEGMNLFYLS